MAIELKTKDNKPVQWQGEKVYASEKSGVVKTVNTKDRTLTIVGTDETKDRDGDIILVKGWNMENFLKNPVFLYAHDYSGIPLAAATKVVKKKSPGRLEFHEKFAPEGMYPLADLILNLYNEKILNACSVGFIPREWEPLERTDSDRDSDIFGTGRRYTKQELLELSGCAVPSNPSALQNSLKGMQFNGFQPIEYLRLINEQGVPEVEKQEAVLDAIGIHKMEFEDDTELKIFVPKEYVATCTVEEAKGTMQRKKAPVTDPDVEEEFKTVKGEREDKITYSCECIECGHKMDSEKHCKDIKCPECDGTMRRVERPGEGQESFTDDGESLSSEIDKRVGVPKDLPLAPEDTAWDASKAEKAVRKWASSDDSGDADKVDWSKYKKAFLYFDQDNAEKVGSYKGPIVDVIDGKLKAVWKGCAAAMAALNGARGGFDVPDTDRKAMYNMLAVYYKRFDKELPELRGLNSLLVSMIDLEIKLTFLDEEVKQLGKRIENIKSESRSAHAKDHGDTPDLYGAILDMEASKNKDSVDDKVVRLSKIVKELSKIIGIMNGGK